MTLLRLTYFGKLWCWERCTSFRKFHVIPTIVHMTLSMESQMIIVWKISIKSEIPALAHGSRCFKFNASLFGHLLHFRYWYYLPRFTISFVSWTQTSIQNIWSFYCYTSILWFLSKYIYPMSGLLAYCVGCTILKTSSRRQLRLRWRIYIW